MIVDNLSSLTIKNSPTIEKNSLFQILNYCFFEDYFPGFLNLEKGNCSRYL